MVRTGNEKGREKNEKGGRRQEGRGKYGSLEKRRRREVEGEPGLTDTSDPRQFGPEILRHQCTKTFRH